MIKIIYKSLFTFFFIKLDHNDTLTRHKRIHRIDKREINLFNSLMIGWSDDLINLSTKLLRFKI